MARKIKMEWGFKKFIMFGCACLVAPVCFALAGDREPAPGGGGGAPAPAPVLDHDGASEVVVARVNGAAIDMKSLMRRMMEIAGQKYGKKEITPLVAQKIRNDAVDALVVEELAYQKAMAEVGAVSDEELAKGIAELTQHHGGEEGFQAFLKREGLSLERYREDVRRTMVVKKFAREKIENSITVTDDEIRQAYQASKDTYFMQKEQVQVTLVTFFLDTTPASMRKADSVRQQMIAEFGGDPEKMPAAGLFAIQATVGVDKDVDPVLYAEAKKLKEKELSPVFAVNDTPRIIQLTGYKAEIAKGIDEVRDYLTNELKKRKTVAKLQEWTAALKNGASIEIVDITQ